MARRIRSVTVYVLNLYDAFDRHLTTSVFAHLSELGRSVPGAPSYRTLDRRTRDGRRFKVSNWFAQVERVPFDTYQAPV